MWFKEKESTEKGPNSPTGVKLTEAAEKIFAQVDMNDPKSVDRVFTSFGLASNVCSEYFIHFARRVSADLSEDEMLSLISYGITLFCCGVEIGKDIPKNDKD